MNELRMTIDTEKDGAARAESSSLELRLVATEEDLRSKMCSHLQKKLFEPDGVYYPIWQALKDDETLTAVVRSRQLHIYRNGKKILILAGKAQPKIIREDRLNEFPLFFSLS